jgi:inorganic triphosphatase YgiF
MAEEIELKLTAPADALPAVRAHPAVAAIASGRLRTHQLVSEYYDTPGRDLAGAGIALRLRRVGTRWLQTVKGDGGAAGGVHRRTEFEWWLPAPRLDLVKLAETPWRKLFAREGGRCRRVFVTAVRRRELPLTFADGTRATLCFDNGEIRAGRRREAVNEIEVEIDHGDALRLFELADALATDLPVRVMHASKAERGFALANGGIPKPRRAREVALATDLAPQMALALIAVDCVSQIEANAEAMLAHDDPEYLHQLRVGWRRLRSLLQLAALVAPAEPIAPLLQELRWLGSILGPARDCDVFGAETLPEVAAEFRGQHGIARLRRRTAQRRRRFSAMVRATIATPRFQRLLLALGGYFTALGRASAPASLPTRARDWIGPVLQQRHDKLVRRARHIHRLSAADRHRARVAAKKLRYAAEFFAPLFSGRRSKAYIVALSKLQSILGRLNDLEVAGKLLDELAPAQDPAVDAYATGIVRGWLAASVAPELKRLRAAQRAFAQCAPFWIG